MKVVRVDISGVPNGMAIEAGGQTWVLAPEVTQKIRELCQDAIDAWDRTIAVADLQAWPVTAMA